MHDQQNLAEISHPGSLLLKDYLEPLGISQNKLAKTMGVPPGRISEIVNGKRAISAETSLRLGKVLGMSDRFWFNLQTDYDFRMAKRTSHGMNNIRTLVKRTG
ncbi:MAG: HigA family addiction module antitoxin [Rhodothermales bacterium]